MRERSPAYHIRVWVETSHVSLMVEGYAAGTRTVLLGTLPQCSAFTEARLHTVLAIGNECQREACAAALSSCQPLQGGLWGAKGDVTNEPYILD